MKLLWSLLNLFLFFLLRFVSSSLSYLCRFRFKQVQIFCRAILPSQSGYCICYCAAAVENVSESETTNETQTELPSGGDEDEDSSVDTPTQKVTPSPTSSLGDNTGGLSTLAPIGQAITTSSPTSNEAVITTLSPTESLTAPFCQHKDRLLNT